MGRGHWEERPTFEDWVERYSRRGVERRQFHHHEVEAERVPVNVLRK